MNRKTYIHKLWGITTAMNAVWPNENIGAALRHNKEYAKNVPKKFGSYKAAWESAPLKDLRQYLRERGVEV